MCSPNWDCKSTVLIGVYHELLCLSGSPCQASDEFPLVRGLSGVALEQGCANETIPMSGVSAEGDQMKRWDTDLDGDEYESDTGPLVFLKRKTPSGFKVLGG